jgi:hypothetical protein
VKQCDNTNQNWVNVIFSLLTTTKLLILIVYHLWLKSAHRNGYVGYMKPTIIVSVFILLSHALFEFSSFPKTRHLNYFKWWQHTRNIAIIAYEMNIIFTCIRDLFNDAVSTSNYRPTAKNSVSTIMEGPHFFIIIQIHIYVQVLAPLVLQYSYFHFRF